MTEIARNAHHHCCFLSRGKRAIRSQEAGKKWVKDAELQEDGERLRDNLEVTFKPLL